MGSVALLLFSVLSPNVEERVIPGGMRWRAPPRSERLMQAADGAALLGDPPANFLELVELEEVRAEWGLRDQLSF